MDFQDKKVLVVATTDNMIWQFVLPHIRWMKSHGAKIECACAKTGFWFEELQKKDLTVYEIDFTRSPFTLKNVKGYKKLKQLQKENKYDLIYCQQPVGGVMGRMLAHKFKLPCIYVAHGFHFFKGNSALKNFVYKTIEKHFSKYATALVTINEEDFVASKNWKPRVKEKINGIGLDFNKYEKLTETKEEIRNSLGIDKDTFVVTTIAEFTKNKNYPTLLSAIKSLKETGCKFVYLICGRGAEHETVEKLIEELDLKNEVKLLGYRKDINRILTATDCFVLGSFREGLPLSVIEAMSFSIPCVVSNVRGSRDLIEQEKGGFVVEPDDSKGFARAIERLCDDKKMRKSFGEYNKEKSRQYSIDEVLKQLEKIYEKI